MAQNKASVEKYYCIECGGEIRNTKVIRVFIKASRAEEFEDPDAERHLCGICAVRELRKNKGSIYYFPQVPKTKARRFEKKYGKYIDVPRGDLLGMSILPRNVGRLSRWYYLFDSGIWPKDFPVTAPVGFEGREYQDRMAYVAPLMALIRAIIGQKESLRYSQMGERHLSEFEFEQWWEAWQEFYLKA